MARGGRSVLGADEEAGGVRTASGGGSAAQEAEDGEDTTHGSLSGS